MDDQINEPILSAVCSCGWTGCMTVIEMNDMLCPQCGMGEENPTVECGSAGLIAAEYMQNDSGLADYDDDCPF